MKPFSIFLFFIYILYTLGFITLIFPEKGVQLSDDFRIKYPSLTKLLMADTTDESAITEILKADFDIDIFDSVDLRIKDSIRLAYEKDSIRKKQLQLHYPNNDKSILYPFFSSLDRARDSNPPVRILHYGDSQIEGDRITSFIRYKLQNKFGGNGPGMLSISPLVPLNGFRQESSDDWKRYTLYGLRDTTMVGYGYGLMANFGRYAPFWNDSVPNDQILYRSWVSLQKSNAGYSTSKKYDLMQLFYGNLKAPVKFSIYLQDSLFRSDTLNPTNAGKIYVQEINQTHNNLSLEFIGYDSPDIYALSLESKTGVLVDNIAMRGSSGTVFAKINRDLLKSNYQAMNIKLLLLQFGGNAVPFIQSENELESYGRWFEAQLKLLKSLIPGVCIIVIGPADMGKIEHGEYTSYTYFNNTRKLLRQATLSQGAAYWDIYSAMGGEGSIRKWVEANPSLAVNDYVHFNERGAAKVAQMFYNTLIEDYNQYKSQSTKLSSTKNVQPDGKVSGGSL